MDPVISPGSAMPAGLKPFDNRFRGSFLYWVTRTVRQQGRNRRMFIRTVLIVAVIVLIPVGVYADEYNGTPTSYRAWVGAGALLVNSGTALANGLSLTTGASNRTSGMFGLVLGSTTMAVSAVGLVTAEDGQSRDFSLLLGATGLASAVTGALSIKFSAPQGQQVSVFPLMNPFGSKDKAKAGLQLQVRF